jgi:hypothetical protein
MSLRALGNFAGGAAQGMQAGQRMGAIKKRMDLDQTMSEALLASMQKYAPNVATAISEGRASSGSGLMAADQEQPNTPAPPAPAMAPMASARPVPAQTAAYRPAEGEAPIAYIPRNW